jgi:hypothetical protein
LPVKLAAGGEFSGLVREREELRREMGVESRITVALKENKFPNSEW